MKLVSVSLKEAALCGAIGCVAAIVFLFAFPKGAITTLMHEVFHLPGPGAGIAIIVGPFLVVVALIASCTSMKQGGALIASTLFAALCMLAVRFLGVATNPKAGFDTFYFVLGTALFGLTIETTELLFRNMKNAYRFLLGGVMANAVLLVYYWMVIFPVTAKWIKWEDIPLLMGLCIVCGAAAACMTWLLTRAFAKTIA